ncbi:hypothetical protein CBOM_08050 [Ceraceosorus bombacis]|uniref:Uncharacterized protein n=1 Tax=Ceraceosorus bombacis TaxID=401625 RepID=A0A0P1BKN6_9BASI|nr:hypothetical protein CBOM_08050 [Ceraceosorus bombacis]
MSLSEARGRAACRRIIRMTTPGRSIAADSGASYMQQSGLEEWQARAYRSAMAAHPVNTKRRIAGPPRKV